MSCSNCNINLAGLEYVEKDNNDLCILCYNSIFGKTCTACQILIPIGAKFSKYGENYWHKNCFQCTSCKTPLSSFKIDDNEDFYCRACYNEKYALKCIVCQTAITMSLRHVESEGRVFHEDCFRCSLPTCAKKLDNGYIPKDNEFFCQECYQEIISRRTFNEIFTFPSIILSELLCKEETVMKSIGQSFKTELIPTIKSSMKKLLIPKVLNKNLLVSNTEQVQPVLHLFPNIVMNTSVHNGSIYLLTGDLAKQDVDVIVVCSTSEVLFNSILQQAGSMVTEEYIRLSAKVNRENSIIETGAGNLNCKAILFVSWIPPINQDSTTLCNSISEFVSKSLHHIFYHPNVYKTVAFPAIGCDLSQCPVDIVAKGMIDATVAKLAEIVLYDVTVSFVILPNEFDIHQRFADRLILIQKPSEPFGYMEYSFSQLTLTFTAKQETNLKKCRSNIETHMNTCTQTKCRENEENLNIWTQQLVLSFYKYCLDHYIWPTIDFEQRKIILLGKKESIDDADKYFLELTTQALKHTHLNSILRTIVWEYQLDSSTWQSYSYKCTAEIEYACSIKQLLKVEITNEQSETCQIDFTNNTEIVNHRVRNIQRRILISHSLPTHWEVQSSNCCRFLLSEQSEEYKNIKQLFDETMLNSYICIKSIERIQNQRWYKQYVAHRDAMNERLKQETERQLFHGCNEKAADSIIEECFNRSYAGINGTLYGHGVYFATTAKYSDPYTRLNQANERCMFVVSVLIGRSIRGDSSMKVPPTGYDSTTDNNQIFVVYHDAQAYADYLIKYQ